MEEQQQELRPRGEADDPISALPNDVLHNVLGRLGCARAAARTSVLSRRWRAVWTGLPDLVFRGVAPGPLLPVLTSLKAVSPGLSLLDIVIPGPDLAGTAHIPSLIDAAAGLSPVDLRLSQMHQFVHAHFPEFRRAASADLCGLYVLFPGPSPSFPALRTIDLTDCCIHLPALLLNCPRLRVLRTNACMLCQDHVTVRSTGLQELVVSIKTTPTNRIDIDAPALKHLTMYFHTGGKLAVSVSAPVLENLTWGCSYPNEAAGLGCWGLRAVSSETAERGPHADEDEMILNNLPPRVTKLWLRYSSWYVNNKELAFLTEIEKHMVTDLSGLELHLATMGHIFGAFLVRLLGMQLLGLHRVCTPTRSLKIFLHASKAKGEECIDYCRCSRYMDPDWRSQTMSLNDLQEVEIQGLEGTDHEFDFLQLIFRCAPMLRRVDLRPSNEHTPGADWCTKMYNIFKEHPFVECNLALSSGM